MANGGGGQALALDSLARVLNRDYSNRVALHEAGHFLVAYLLGAPPKEFSPRLSPPSPPGGCRPLALPLLLTLFRSPPAHVEMCNA